MEKNLDIVIFGLSITSSWGNGHATTFRHLVEGLCSRGHRVTFLERNVPWYAGHRDLPEPPFGETYLYESLEEATDTHADRVRDADLVIVGSYVPDGIPLGRWVIEEAGGIAAFYDIDTPVTLAALDEGCCEYLTPELIADYQLYLSFTGGPTLERLQAHFDSPCAKPLYCSVDPNHYFPEPETPLRHDLGYMGTYSVDRQPGVEKFLVAPARDWPEGRYVVAGPQYPDSIEWPSNVQRLEHLPPHQHRDFYNSQRFTLNITREAMRRAGYAPSIRLFEAAACATPIVSDFWPGLDELFEIGSEILVPESSAEVLEHLQAMDETKRIALGRASRDRVLSQHTGRHRAMELEQHFAEAFERRYRKAMPALRAIR